MAWAARPPFAPGLFMASCCAISARVGTEDQARGCELGELSRLAAEVDRAGRRNDRRERRVALRWAWPARRADGRRDPGEGCPDSADSAERARRASVASSVLRRFT